MQCNCDKCDGKPVGLAHIGIMVTDMERSKDFYVHTLGFELTNETTVDSGAKLAFLNIGSCAIELIMPADPSSVAGRSAGPVDHFAIEVTGIDSLVCRLYDKGVEFESDKVASMPNLLGGTRGIFFKGPDGERLEFFEYV